MRKFILVVILVVVAGLFSVALRQRMDAQRRDRLISWVRSSLQEEIAKDKDTYSEITIGEIALLKESSNKYRGYVEYKYGNHSDKPRLEVSIDSGNMMYQCEPPRALLAERAFRSAEEQAYDNGSENGTLLEYNDSTAKWNLRLLATAAESYAAANGGNYPVDMDVLINADYINNNFSNATIDGFTYHCLMSENGYTFEAMPVQPGVTGTERYVINTKNANF